MQHLLQQLPLLESHFSASGFAQLPTPVAPYDFNGRQIWVKRDDLSHSIYGGNKIRKLTVILPLAQKLGADTIVTFGATGTHHGLATAIFCKQLGLACELLLFDQPVTQAVQDNIRMLSAQQATLKHCGSLANTLRRFYCDPARLGKRKYFLFAGGSNVFGVLAFINAALELKVQVDAGECELPSKLYCAASSNATVAGLTLGVALAGMATEVIGVRVAPRKVGPFDSCTPAAIRKLMQQTVKWLQQQGVQWRVPVPAVRLLDEWYGAGYGYPYEASTTAAQLFEETVSVPLDLTYTAKCFAAVLAAGQQSTAPIMYWHSLSSAPLAPLMAGFDEANLVPSLRQQLRPQALVY